MTVRQFIKELQLLKSELLDKEIVVRLPNDLLVEPSIKFILKPKYQCNPLKAGLTKNSVDKVIITWD